MHQLDKKDNGVQHSTVLAFVDYRKAFDSVEIPAILEAIENHGVDPTYINILKHTYQNATSFIRLHKDSDPFKLEKGARQGDCISPKLFTACLEQVFRKLNWEEMGIKIDGQMLNNLRFADDIVLVSEDPGELQEMLEQLNTESKAVGLKMNLSKTQVMFNDLIEEENQKIKIDGATLKAVKSYTYRGQLVSMDSNKEIEVNDASHMAGKHLAEPLVSSKVKFQTA